MLSDVAKGGVREKLRVLTADSRFQALEDRPPWIRTRIHAHAHTHTHTHTYADMQMHTHTVGGAQQQICAILRSRHSEAGVSRIPGRRLAFGIPGPFLQ